MFFRSLSLMRFSPSVAKDLERLEEALSVQRLRECGPLETSTRGFVPVIGRGSDAALTHTVNGVTFFAAGCEEKVLPGSFVDSKVEEKVQRIAQDEGRKVGGRERKRLKEDVLTDLLPRAFVRSSRLRGYVDMKEGWVVIETTSRRAAEAVISQIREALGSFPAVPLAPEESPRVLMTQWVSDIGTLPAGLGLGDECELREPTSQGAISRSRRQDLTSDDITEHLRQGKQVFHLGAVFEERLTFVLGEDLSVKKLKFLDVVADELGSHHADAAAQTDATLVLMALELSKLFAKLTEWFALRRPTDT